MKFNFSVQKSPCIRIQLCSFVYLLSMAAFATRTELGSCEVVSKVSGPL